MNWKLLLFSWSPSIVRGSGANGAVILITKMSRNFSGRVSDESSLGWQNFPELWFSTIPRHLNSVLFCSSSLDLALFQKHPVLSKLRSFGVSIPPPSTTLLNFYLHVYSISQLYDPPWQVGILFTIMVAGLSTKLENKYSVEDHCW